MKRERGFTLIELLVVMGIFTIFATFLVQIMRSSVVMFDEGERNQDLAARADAAARVLRQTLSGLTGPRPSDPEPGADMPPPARMLVQWVPLKPAAGDADVPMVQALRAAVQLDEDDEVGLLRKLLRAEAEQTAPSRAPEAVERHLAAMVARMPRAHRGSLLLIPRPSPDASDDGAFFELRRLLLLPGQELPLDERRTVDPMLVPQIGSAALPLALIDEHSEVIAKDLLHVELRMWSQLTTSWDAAAGDGAAEWVWDSARAGLLSQSDDPMRRFALDLGPDSLSRTHDDVFPRWLLVRAVVAPRQGSEAVLAAELGEAERTGRVLDESRLPDVRDARMLKIGDEWVEWAGATGRNLTGLRRGRRGTVAKTHPAGTRVRAGRQIEVLLPLAHARESWNE